MDKKRSEFEAEAHRLLRDIIQTYTNFDYIAPDDVPDIPLYMDQVTTFMDQKLAGCKRYPDDKILTKTMINNYTKNKVIPSPEKKKYSKEHLLLLILVYYFKDFLCIDDIKTILAPLIKNHFQNEDGISMREVYSRIFDLVSGQTESITKDLVRRFEMAEEAFPGTENDTEGEERDKEYLNTLSFICLLGFDVYVKKKMIESIADKLNRAEEEARAAEKQAAEEAKKAAKEKRAEDSKKKIE